MGGAGWVVGAVRAVAPARQRRLRYPGRKPLDDHQVLQGILFRPQHAKQHDAVGFPGAPCHGKEAVRAFYQYLTQTFRTEHEEELHRYVSADALTLEAKVTGVVVGSMLGLPGNGRRVTFRIPHVFEFRDGLISRENGWLDTAAVAKQLSS